ncbi:MAG: pyridoxal-dependent decarboxylase [Gemmatimonadaceae bacterium]|jgi:L-2,4-diaminobutyrate decarboxylase|nr:pyridoxal-dependent decarboxylase [Gemmatimonadaceae bacterium]
MDVIDTTMHDALLAPLEADATLEGGAPLLALVAEYFARTRAGDGPVSTRRTVAEVTARLGEHPSVDGAPLEAVAARLARDLLPDVNHLAHPMYMGHQVSAPLPAAVWTEPLIAATNNGMAVREMSPVFTPIERHLLRWACDLVGWGPAAGGTMTSGGTEATFVALLAARSAAIPDVWSDGVGAEPPVVVHGAHAHYAITRAVGQLGLGLRQAIAIPTRGHRMDVEALARTLAELAASNRRVMAVVATAGCTPTGSFDDLSAIGAQCAAYGHWLHVDAAHGGGALLSPAHRARLAGIDRAQTVAWDPHKMLLMPLSAGMVLARDELALDRAFAQSAPYLFHPGADGDERRMDQGVRSFQCSRRADALKLWVALERYGTRHLGALHDHLCALARQLHDRLAARDDFEVLHSPDSNILCFRYVGGLLAVAAPAVVDAFTDALRDRWNGSGVGWITATTLDGRRVLRVTMMNPRTGAPHVERLVDGLAALGETMLRAQA